ncbi:MAG: trypsin-like peptidase domain-containing protein [Acidobacteriota bacterium]
MRNFVVAVVLIMVSLPLAANQRGPVIVGEHVEVGLETPHPYPASPSGDARLVWVDEIVFPGATYIAVHFERMELGDGDFVIVRSEDGLQQWTYTGNGRHNLGISDEGFFATHLKGDSAVVELYASGGTSAFGYRIDKFGRGYSDLEIEEFWAMGLGEKMNLAPPASWNESICTADDTDEAKCYESSDPDAYDTGRAVARLMSNGSAHCTGWLVGNEGHLMTNEHCITSQTQLNSIDVEFMAEGADCATNCASSLACPGIIEASGGVFVTDNADLDYALVIPDTSTANSTDLPATYGYMKLRQTGAVLDERLYIVQHPAGWGKRLAMESSYPAPPDSVDGLAHVVSLTEVACTGATTYDDVGYWADTQGGSSGSPVLGYSDNKVIALHHCRGSSYCTSGNPDNDDPNRGVPIQEVIDDLVAQDLMPGGALCDPFAGPTSLTADVTGPNAVELTWDAVGGAGITYEVYRAFGSCPQAGGEVIAEGLTATTFVDSTVSGGSTYSYVVKAVEPTEGCQSDPSPCAEALATGDCLLDPTFAGIQSVSNSADATCTLDLAWDPGASNCGNGVVYNVYRSETPGFTPDASTLLAENVSGSPYTDTDTLEFGHRYLYVVRAVDAVNGMEESNTVEAGGRPTGPVTVADWIDDLEAYVTMTDAEGAGWGHAAADGTDDWDLVVGDDHTSGTGNAFVAADVSTVTDKWMITQQMVIDATSILSFWHKFDFEDGFDGGVLELSIDDGASWIDLGPQITAGVYNDTISTCCSNPIGGRQAWSGTQATFGEVTVDLSIYAGETVVIRWRMGCDSSVDAGDWKIDDFFINDAGTGGPCETGAGGHIFTDGFESGGTTAWSVTTP